MKSCEFELSVDLPDDIEVSEVCEYLKQQLVCAVFGDSISNESQNKIDAAFASDDAIDSIDVKCTHEQKY